MDSAPHPEVPQAILDHIRLVISQTRILVAGMIDSLHEGANDTPNQLTCHAIQ